MRMGVWIWILCEAGFGWDGWAAVPIYGIAKVNANIWQNPMWSLSWSTRILGIDLRATMLWKNGFEGLIFWLQNHSGHSVSDYIIMEYNEPIIKQLQGKKYRVDILKKQKQTQWRFMEIRGNTSCRFLKKQQIYFISSVKKMQVIYVIANEVNLIVRWL